MSSPTPSERTRIRARFDEMEVRLRDFTREPGTTFRYVYDMGDNWAAHRVPGAVT